MSFKSIFFKDAEEDPADFPMPTPPPVERKAPVVFGNTFTTPSVNLDTQSGVDYIAQLQDLMPEAEYKVFIGTFSDMNSLPLSEQQKYDTAFKGLKRTGMTVDKLLSSGRNYLAILDKEAEEFQQAVSHKKTVDIDQKNELILKDQQLIQEASLRVSKLQEEVNTTKTELDVKELHFKNAISNQKAIVEDQLTKITKHLNGNSGQ